MQLLSPFKPPLRTDFLAPAMVWVIACGLMIALRSHFNLGNLALLMVLASAVASLWLQPFISILTSSVAVILFNWFFVNPRFTLTVELSEDALLLLTMLAVSTVISYLMKLTRSAADSEAKHELQSRIATENAKIQQVRNMLLTSISHDYRTPLTTLMSAASTIAEQAGRVSPDKISQLATLILEEASQLHRMTTNTLQLARLDNSKIIIPFSWESAEEMIGTVAIRARRNYPGRIIHTQLPDRIPLLYVDPILINQLLDNLVDNAVKNSPDSEPVLISIQTEIEHLTIAIQDHGIGIPDEFKTKVFEIFERVETMHSALDSSARRGIGIGLAVCRAIAQVHSATLEVKDTLGGGTTVILRFPLIEQPEQPMESGV
jgi:K+-sensing histidine kinase KdpD